jgi:hypothetical protein
VVTGLGAQTDVVNNLGQTPLMIYSQTNSYDYNMGRIIFLEFSENFLGIYTKSILKDTVTNERLNLHYYPPW